MLRTAAILASAPVIAARVLRQTRRTQLEGKVVIVTGTRGLSFACAELLCRLGAKLCLLAKDPIELERVCDRLPGEAIGIACDVTDPESTESAVQNCIAHYGGVDALVNVADLVVEQTGEPLDAFEAALTSHFWAPLYVINAVVPHMKARKAGPIVNVAAVDPLAALETPRLVSRRAFAGLSDALRAELSEDGIWVTTVAPGIVVKTAEQTVVGKELHAMDVDWAAVRIVDALRHGDPALVLSLRARLFAIADAVAPSVTIELMRAARKYLGDGVQKPIVKRTEPKVVPMSAVRATD